VSAKSVDLQKVFKTVAGQTGIEIVLVGRPADPIRVTVSIERQPVERAIKTILRTSSFSGPAPPSYSFVYSGDVLRSVRILFPASGSPARPSRSPENLSARDAQEQAAAEATPEEKTTGETVSSGSVSDEKDSDETQSVTLEPGKIWGRPLTATERRQLIAELQAAGIPTDALDEGQLSGVKRLKDLGLSLPEIREALPEPPRKR
jgi:hypothetical protein